MKGISAIIATILLLLIVIAIVGFTFGFFQNLFTTSSTAATNQLNTTTGQLSQSFAIENIYAGSPTTKVVVTLVPTGTSALITNNLAVYINGTLSTATGGWSTSGNRVIWTATANGACTSSVYKVSGPANQASITC